MPGDEQLSREGQLSHAVGGALETAFAGLAGEGAADEEMTTPIVLEGALVVSVRRDEFKIPMIARAERSADGEVKISFHDPAETLLLEIVGDTGTVNIRVQYSDKPLGAALTSARFFEALATAPGVLSFEVQVVVGEGEPVPHRLELSDLPFAVPEPQLEDYRNRLRLLEGLYDIWLNTGVEIRYPAHTDDPEGLRNFNFVVRAIRGGWVALSVTSFDIHVPATQARTLLEESPPGGEISRAFYFEVPKESYPVFGKGVDLGPSSRYLAGARLATTREEVEDQISATKGDDTAVVNLVWEPIEDRPLHVFDQWPKESAQVIAQDLQEYEALYGVSSQRFKQAWEQREPWLRKIPDGARWFSLIQAHEELAAES